jgi:hypothetical protein
MVELSVLIVVLRNLLGKGVSKKTDNKGGCYFVTMDLATRAALYSSRSPISVKLPERLPVLLIKWFFSPLYLKS